MFKDFKEKLQIILLKINIKYIISIRTCVWGILFPLDSELNKDNMANINASTIVNFIEINFMLFIYI